MLLLTEKDGVAVTVFVLERQWYEFRPGYWLF